MEKKLNLIVVGNPHVCNDIAIYLAQHNIPFVDIKDMQHNDNKSEKVLIINAETKLSDVVRVIEMENNITPIIIETMPRFEEPIILSDMYENKPFYYNLGEKGGKKNKKRFGR